MMPPRNQTFRYSAPGSIMLAGEHAVLRGAPAIVASILDRLTVTLVVRDDHRLLLKTPLGSHACTTQHITDHPKLDYLMAILKGYQSDLTTGCNITVTSDINHQVGLGSSAALTAATHACIQHWRNGKAAQKDSIYDMGMQSIQDHKGVGSGADLAASVFGGCLAYRQTPYHLATVTTAYPRLAVIYSGHKTPTAEVIQHIAQRFKNKALNSIDQTIKQCVTQAIAHLKHCDDKALGRCFLAHQEALKSLGVCTPELASAIESLNQHPSITGAKISGAGLGDCAIGVVDRKHGDEPIALCCRPPCVALSVALGQDGLIGEPIDASC